MNVPFMDLAAGLAEVELEMQEAIQSVFRRCAFAGNPPVVRDFEERFAQYCGVGHCVGVGSGTAALELLLRAYRVGRGDEVILPANTFVAAAEAICLAGARPVFVDVNASDAQLDVECVERAINRRTRGIIVVHLYGQLAEMSSLIELARGRNLWVIEDASQAHGGSFAGRRAGGLADAAAFSFYPSKNLGACGEAGCITTDDAGIAQRVRKLSDHGARDKDYYDEPGRNDRMDGIQAAVLDVKLPRLDSWNRQRREIADVYRRAFQGHPQIRLFSEVEHGVGVYHLFVVRLQNRDRLREQLAARGVATRVHYPIPLHLQPAYQGLGPSRGGVPVCETLAAEVLSLPMYPQIGPEKAEYVAGQLIQLVQPETPEARLPR